MHKAPYTEQAQQLRIFPKVQTAEFICRPNRFVIDCLLNGRRTRAYLPNPGRLWELLLPGSTVYLVTHDSSPGRTTPYTCVAVERQGNPVMLHTHHTNTVAQWLMDRGSIPGLEDFSVAQREVTFGKSRFDFLLSDGTRELVLEVKSCTLFSGDIAMFPDAVTARGTRHLTHLAQLSRDGRRAGVLFVVHWPDARYFMPEYHTDLLFSRTLCTLKDALFVKAIAVQWTRDLSIADNVREIEIPWSLIEEEAGDRGSYMVVLRLRKSSTVAVGQLGTRHFKKGFYIYVGSAKRSLQSRIARHRRAQKTKHWHIDYLREEADFITALPVLTSADLECGMAAELQSISDWTIRGFGSSDCPCETHLFGMREHPLAARPFIEVLHRFRIDRLSQCLARDTKGGFS
jgi:sugar fermentation stimulation protein A